MNRTVCFLGEDRLARRVGSLIESASLTLKSLQDLDVDAALTELKTTATPTVIVDSRSAQTALTTVTLNKRLAAGALPALNLITIGDQFYPASIAAELQLLALDHFQLSAAGEIQDPQRLLQHLQSAPGRPVPECRHVEAGGVELKTYTREFFPVVDDIVRVADRGVTLLLVGETGTGKTTLAKLVHTISSRRGHPFQNLACGALPPDLIESELFGHMRGAFTGAERNKMGRFQAAGRGSLLLDEIDVLDVKQQTKLLKVIETGEYEMVGSTESNISQARLIVASNVNLKEQVETGKFRLDLYYRLNVLEFRLLPLRERPLDLIPLAMQFIEELTTELNIEVVKVHRDFLNALQEYHWPGNLRELKNHLRRAILFCEEGELHVRDLSHKIVQAQFAPTPERQPKESSWKLIERVAQSEKEMLRAALEANGNNRTQTARALGISRVGLYKKLRRLGLIDDSANEPVPA